MNHMNKNLQKIFSHAAVSRMRDELRAGTSLEMYFKDFPLVDEKDCLSSTIEIPSKIPILKTPKNDPASADLENAIVLHSYYPNLDETQASDPRLWTYLSHVDFRRYTLARWGLKGAPKDILKDGDSKQKAITYLQEHWFSTYNDLKGLRRNAIARLWWAAHLTYAPWERDPQFFSSLKKDDPYYYTRVLFQTQDIYQSVLERALGRSEHILISILDYLARNPEFSNVRNNVRSLVKELNLVYGTKKIIALDQKQLATLIQRIAADVPNTQQEENKRTGIIGRIFGR